MSQPVGYLLLPLEQFEVDKYLGNWYQIGAIRKWFEPAPKNVKLAINKATDGLLLLQLELELMGKVCKTNGSVKINATPTNFTISIPKVILGININTSFEIKAVITNANKDYVYLLINRNDNSGLHIISRYLSVDDEMTEYLKQLVKGFNDKPELLKFN